MKKIKKILLAFAPLTAIAIATPIVLTACSGTTTNTTTPDDNNNGNGGNGDNSKPITPSFVADNTNSIDFALDASSEAQKILEKYKAAKGKTLAEKVLTDELASFPKKDSGTLAKDVLNMWSNNNWFTITQTAKDAKVKETFISSLTINKAEVDSMSKATFDVEYKSAFNDSTGKLYEAKQLLKVEKANVDVTTKIEIPKEVPQDGYKINGEIQKLPATSLLATEVSSDPKTNLENNLKQNKVSLDAKLVFQTFISNHNIKHAEEETTPPVMDEGTWLESAKTNANVTITNKTQMDVFLDKFSSTETWVDLNKTSTESDIRKAVYTQSGNVYNLNEKFKNLISSKDLFKLATLSPSVKNKVLSFVITLKKDANDNAPKTLKLNIKFS